jgi:hypothetical protein
MKKAALTARSLKKTYGPYALHVLAGHLVEDDNGYTLIEGKTLPTPEEYNRLAEKYYTYTVDSLIDDAFSVIEELAGEMREGFDNMEGGNLGSTQKCQTYGETADTLEGVNAPDLPDALNNIKVIRYPSTSKSTGRAHRASEASSDLNLAADAIEEWVTDKREMLDERDDDDNEETEEELDLDGLDSLAEELRNAASELEGCEFPGMFG